jgi:hypothetical protein
LAGGCFWLSPDYSLRIRYTLFVANLAGPQAVLAVSKNGKVVQNGLKAKSLADFVRDRCKIVMIQIDDLTTPLTNKVVVRLAGYDLILGATPAQIGLAQDAQIAKPFQGTIDRREIHTMLLLADPFMDTLCTGMAI